jgi:hypothetical protein
MSHVLLESKHYMSILILEMTRYKGQVMHYLYFDLLLGKYARPRYRYNVLKEQEDQ